MTPEQWYGVAARWAVPVAFVIGGVLLGLLVNRVLVARLRALAAKTPWLADNLILAALGRSAVVWLAALGVYVATFNLPVDAPANVLGRLRDVLFVVVALSITVAAARLAAGLSQLYGQRSDGALPGISIFSNLAKLIVFVLGGLIILQSLGIAITPILTALGVGGLAVALALQDTLSNLFSGFQIIASRQIRPGDYVKLSGGEEGYVRDITWRITTIESVGKVVAVVPNAKLASAIVQNYHLPDTEQSLLVKIGVHYDSDLEHVERVCIEVAKGVMREVEGGVPEYDPVVRFNDFADSAVQGNVVMRVQEFNNQFLIRHEFMKRLHRRFREEGIVIPYPIRTLYIERDSGEAHASDGAPERTS